MNVVIVKGPMFEQAKEKAQETLYRVLMANTKEQDKKIS